MIARLIVGLIFLTMGAGFATAQSAAPPDQTRQRDLVLSDAPPPPSIPAGPTVPRGYALVIGVSTYRNLDERNQLLYSESDAQAVYRSLISNEGGAFPAENVHMLLGPQATLANIRRELEEWLPSVAQPSDRVVVFFAGHGFVSKGRGYLAPWDVDLDRIEETAYPMARLGEVLATRVKATWKVLLTDACHSGKITPETTNESLDSQFNSLPSNFLTLTATTEREQSYEDPQLSTGFGFFTYFLTQAWRGQADTDPCDGRITADELIEYVRSNVRRYARERQLSQTPTARGDYDPQMLLGVSSSCLPRADDDDDRKYGTAIVEVNLDDVDLYVDGALVGTLTRGKPLRIPRLVTGIHEFKGVRRGYEPDTKQVMIPPGQEVTVTLRIRYMRQVRPAALELGEQGERLLFSQRSSINPLNILPVARSQSQADLRRARDLFIRALAEDPNYSRAAFNLGQAHQLLGDQAASLEAYKRAIEIDPSYIEARAQYAAVLIESGDTDQAIRELTEASRLDADDHVLFAMLARAYWDKGVWARAVEAADRSLSLNPSNEQAHLWRADALRQMAAAEKDPAARARLYREARDHYRQFLSLTNFSSSIGERLAFHFVGFGVGSRRHADREDAYKSLRSAGYLGLCITEQNVGNLLRAREYCQRAVPYGEENPITYFVLGNINRDLFNAYGLCEFLRASASNYSRMLKLNSDLVEAKNARNYLEQIGAIVAKLRC